MEDNIKKEMTQALKEIVVPTIKSLGFSGTFPHYRKESGEKLEFISIQFNRHGGSFVIEYGKTTKPDLSQLAKTVPFEKLNYGYLHPNDRKRLKPENTGDDFWFSYAEFQEKSQFVVLANSTVPLLESLKN